MNKNSKEQNIASRPPVVVIMGHIDHGKSTLLDYIRKTNIVEKEAGGITQHIAAYEVIHKDEHGADRKITFLDTPGHEAFSAMRERGAKVADIAILVVSAEDSVKAQTIEALKVIKESNVPYIVAINKIDKPGANIEKTKIDLSEKEVYLEGYGGNIPSVEISAKMGQNVNHLLDLIILSADVEGFTGDRSKPAEGIVIESHLDSKRGISATVIIKDGTLSKGMFAVAGEAFVGMRMLENFLGAQIDSASFSSPVRLVGWNTVPKVGEKFNAYENKKEAEAAAKELGLGARLAKIGPKAIEENAEIKQIPLVIKTDVAGSIEAIEKEVFKLGTDSARFRILSKGVGAINESDVKLASAMSDTIIVGFNVKVDKSAEDIREKLGASIQTFSIIYKLIEWLKDELEKRRPRKEIIVIAGKAKVQKTFSRTKERQIVGGKVFEGKIVQGGPIRILRRDFEVGTGRIVGLEQTKTKTKEVESPNEFGAMIETKIDVAPGDFIESFTVEIK